MYFTENSETGMKVCYRCVIYYNWISIYRYIINICHPISIYGRYAFHWTNDRSTNTTVAFVINELYVTRYIINLTLLDLDVL